MSFRQKLHETDEYRTLDTSTAAAAADDDESSGAAVAAGSASSLPSWGDLPREDREMLLRWATLILLALIYVEVRKGRVR